MASSGSAENQKLEQYGSRLVRKSERKGGFVKAEANSSKTRVVSIGGRRKCSLEQISVDQARGRGKTLLRRNKRQAVRWGVVGGQGRGG